MSELVLVTGGSGFIASHCILKLLTAGYRVRTTVRRLAREADMRTMLRESGVDAGDRLEFVEANLKFDDGWLDAAQGCTYVLHVASPLPVRQPRNHDVLVRPAREGALRVLKAARDAGVRRVVLTSSFAAIGYGHGPRTTPFTEADWTDPANQGAYVKSKTLAEAAAWDFVAREGGGMELTTVNPVVVLGPALQWDVSASVELIRWMMRGRLPLIPNMSTGVVDVRDVADLHLAAMTSHQANGERFLATAGRMTLQDIARTLKERLGPSADKVSTRTVPSWIMRIAARFNETARTIVEGDGTTLASSEKARRMLGWQPRSAEDAVAATGVSLVRMGLV